MIHKFEDHIFVYCEIIWNQNKSIAYAKALLPYAGFTFECHLNWDHIMSNQSNKYDLTPMSSHFDETCLFHLYI